MPASREAYVVVVVLAIAAGLLLSFGIKLFMLKEPMKERNLKN